MATLAHDGQSAKHTPGPWQVYGSRPLGVCTKSDWIALLGGPDGAKQLPAVTEIANARLIAAAPELLAELQSTADALSWAAQEAADRNSLPKSILGGIRHHADLARAAIAKATGQ